MRIFHMGPNLTNEVPDLHGYTTITQSSVQRVSLYTELKPTFPFSKWQRHAFAGL